MSKIKVAVLGATGVVGQRIVAMLGGHPWFEVSALCASSESAGNRYADAVAGRWKAPGSIPEWVRDLVVAPCVPDGESRIAFSALDANVAGPIEEDFARAGCFVSSNAKNHRMRPEVPLIIPEINPTHLALLKRQSYGTGGILTNPNCSTTGLALALAPLHARFGVKRVFVTTMQAISGAGYPGVPSLDILGNVIPHIGGEEAKMETEPLKILGELERPAPIQISAHCNRVPTSSGHMMSVSVELARAASLDEIKQELGSYNPLQGRGLPTAPARPIVVVDEPDRPQPAIDSEAGGGMTVTIGRLRSDPILTVRFTALVHNLVRGAAGAAILNAELLVQEGYTRA